jgi:tRNA threonylcarbamoyladenosine biosynthesis protein TsaE
VSRPASDPTRRLAARLRSESAEATRAFGTRLGRQARRGDVFALTGELGAGKTCLVQGLAAGLDVTDPVTSPTFIMIAEYAGRLPLHHVDLYRLERPEEIRGLGLEELLDGDGVTVVEWAEKADPLWPRRTVRIRIDGAGGEPRAIEVEGLRPDWEAPPG